MHPHLIEDIAKVYFEALFDTNKFKALAEINRALGNNVPAEEIVFKVVLPGIERMTDSLVNSDKANLSQHFIASQICEEAIDLLLPMFNVAPNFHGHVVIGTSFGDFHGLGKKIVRGCLRAALFSVTDLGINVSAEKFVDEAIAQGASVIGISSMMAHTARSSQGPLKVRAILRERGLEENIKLVVGGAPYRFDPELYKAVGADAWGENGMDAIRVIGRLMREVKS